MRLISVVDIELTQFFTLIVSQLSWEILALTADIGLYGPVFTGIKTLNLLLTLNDHAQGRTLYTTR